MAEPRGVTIADTTFDFGFDARTGGLMLIMDTTKGIPSAQPGPAVDGLASW